MLIASLPPEPYEIAKMVSFVLATSRISANPTGIQPQPMSPNFPINDPTASEQQITWEYQQLRDADIISFWFSVGSLNPIVLYELGRWGNSSNKKIVIGVDKEYERKQDVVIQTKLSRPEVSVCESINSFINEIKLQLCHIKK